MLRISHQANETSLFEGLIKEINELIGNLIQLQSKSALAS
jgi:hypothetical protein